MKTNDGVGKLLQNICTDERYRTDGTPGTTKALTANNAGGYDSTNNPTGVRK
jgi:hypothetical protein